MREETIADVKSHFIHTKECVKIRTLTILDPCDYVYMHIGLSLQKSYRFIVTDSWGFEIKD